MMSKNKLYPYILVTLQLGSLGYLLISGPLIAQSWLGILVEAIGFILGVVAIYIAGVHNVNIAPLPKQGSHLITYGPYRYMRHPMYLAQVLAVIPLVIDYFTYIRLTALLLLIFALLLKIPYEEKGLKHQFGEDYIKYMKSTKRVIPFIC